MRSPIAPMVRGVGQTRDVKGEAMKKTIAACLLTALAFPTLPANAAEPVIAMAAGDISDDRLTNQDDTAALLGPSELVLALGDLQYENGSLADFNRYYEPTWGVHKSKTLPVTGNHEYNTPYASGYFTYFNDIPAYYSYDRGAWHFIALDSQIPHKEGTPQNNWLENDLNANTQPCILAYWHKPLFSIGRYAKESTKALWADLYAKRADLIVVAHDHNYQRWAQMTPSGTVSAQGIRQFIIGTGGAGFYPFVRSDSRVQAKQASTFGVVKFTLADTSYSWQFVPIQGQSYSDSGSATCH
jgi:hypothetical protein